VKVLAALKPKKKRDRWRDDFYVTAFELSRAGMTEHALCRFFGVDKKQWRAWVAKEPALRDAVARGRSTHTKNKGGRPEGEKFYEYVYRLLPDHLRRTWDALATLFNKRLATPARIDSLLGDKGKHARMHLWFYALTASNFNFTEACRKVNVTTQCVYGWAEEEPKFKELLDNVKRMMKDYGEGCLFRAMSLGDASCIIFFNKTVNADRGYAQEARSKMTLEVSGAVSHLHAPADAEAVVDALPLGERRRMLEALRAARDGKKLPPKVVRDAPPEG
jgi:hypothetical protein